MVTSVVSHLSQRSKCNLKRGEPGFQESLSKLRQVVIIWRKLLLSQASFSITSQPEPGKTACLFTAIIMLKRQVGIIERTQKCPCSEPREERVGGRVIKLWLETWNCFLQSKAEPVCITKPQFHLWTSTEVVLCSGKRTLVSILRIILQTRDK